MAGSRRWVNECEGCIQVATGWDDIKEILWMVGVIGEKKENG